MHRVLPTLLWVTLSILPVAPAAAQGDRSPPPTAVRISAEFVPNPRCPVFPWNADVSVEITVDGPRAGDDSLCWSLVDWQGHVLAMNSIRVPAGEAAWHGELKVPNTRLAGYFEIYLALEQAKGTIPQTGTRPEGFVAYGILPNIEPLTLAHADDSRFGGQGTNFVKSGEPLKGDYVDPVYPLVGMKWGYRSRKPAELAPLGIDSYQPCLDPQKMQEQGENVCEKAAGLSLFVDAHSLPAWLMAIPEGVSFAEFNPTNAGQAYPPNDYAAYEQLIGRIAAEQALNRKINLPGQRRNYYAIHWEPDWHWKGSDEAFLKMYEHAHKAIHENDPDGLLLGANYGVLAVGNSHLERLLAKGLGRWLDGIVFHTYFFPEQQPPEKGNLVADMRKLVGLAKKYLKPDAPLINSEWGTFYGAFPATKCHWALNRNAAWFLRGHLITLGEGADATFYFYTADYSLDGWGLFYNLTYPHPEFGATHLAPKPVMLAAAVATRLLDGTKNLGVLDRLGDGVWGYAFDRNGTAVAALWTLDDKVREVSIAADAAEATAFDPMGNPTTIRCSNGAAQVQVGPVPSYVMGIARTAISPPAEADQPR